VDRSVVWSRKQRQRPGDDSATTAHKSKTVSFFAGEIVVIRRRLLVRAFHEDGEWWPVGSEQNLLYVAVTRAGERLGSDVSRYSTGFNVLVGHWLQTHGTGHRRNA
jgi:hypothetical protein